MQVLLLCCTPLSLWLAFQFGRREAAGRLNRIGIIGQ